MNALKNLFCKKKNADGKSLLMSLLRVKNKKAHIYWCSWESS